MREPWAKTDVEKWTRSYGDGEKLATVCLAVLSLSDNFVINGKWRYSLRGVKVRRGS